MREARDSVAERTARARALQRIRTLGDPILRTPAYAVDRFDEPLKRRAQEMAWIMRRAGGVGLAAPQIGLLQRLVVYALDAEDEVKAIVNPQIEWASQQTTIEPESCLSLPGLSLPVERPYAIRLRCQDLRGAEHELQAEGQEARILQHELDHLDGRLIIDRAEREAKRRYLRPWLGLGDIPADVGALEPFDGTAGLLPADLGDPGPARIPEHRPTRIAGLQAKARAPSG